MLERLLRVDEHLHDLRDIHVPLLRFRHERRGGRDRVVGLAVHRARLARAVVAFVQEAQPFVVVLDAERHARAAHEVVHVFHVDLQTLGRADPAADQANQIVRDPGESRGGFVARRDDLRDPAASQVRVQFAVQGLEGRDVRAQVDANPHGEGQVGHDLLRPRPDSRLDERLTFRDRLERSLEILRGHRGVRSVHEGFQAAALIPEVRERGSQCRDQPGSMFRETPFRFTLKDGSEIKGMSVIVRFGRHDCFLEEFRRFRKVDAVLLPHGQDELGAFDRLQDPFAFGPPELFEGRLDRLLDLGRIPLLVRLSGGLCEFPGAHGLHAEAFDLGEGAMEFLQARLHLAVPVQDRVHGDVRALRVFDRLLEGASSDRLARRVQVLERAFQIDAHVRGDRELFTGRAEHRDDPLELGLLDRLEPLFRELGSLLVVALLDRAFRPGEHVLRGGRVRAHRARFLEDAGKVTGPSVESALERLLRLGPALVEGVLRLLEIENRHIAASPFDQVRGLRRICAEFHSRPD